MPCAILYPWICTSICRYHHSTNAEPFREERVKITEIRKDILDILSDIEVNIDYPEYDIEETSVKKVSEFLDKKYKWSLFVSVLLFTCQLSIFAHFIEKIPFLRQRKKICRKRKI